MLCLWSFRPPEADSHSDTAGRMCPLAGILPVHLRVFGTDGGVDGGSTAAMAGDRGSAPLPPGIPQEHQEGAAPPVNQAGAAVGLATPYSSLRKI